MSSSSLDHNIIHSSFDLDDLLKKEDFERMNKLYCKTKHSHRSQPYDRSPSANTTSSAGTPYSSDESVDDGERVGDGIEHKKYRRVQANKRERTRMHTVNAAFDHLRDLVPTYPSNRKLSKIETLHLACAYIQDLAKLVRETSAVHGEDVNLFHRESFMQYPPTIPGYLQSPVLPIKSEFPPPEFTSSSYQHYRAPLGYVASDCESCPSEPEIPSPPHHYMYMNSPGIGVRPPGLSRVSSDSVAVQMSHTSLNSGSSSYCGSPIANTGAPCSPLTRVQHSTPSLSHGLNSSVQYNVAAFSSVPLSLSNIQTSSFTQCYSQ